MTSEPGRVTGFVLVVAAIAAVAGILFGFDTGVISGAILFINEEFSLTSVTTEVAVSSVLMGAILGALFGGPLSDRVGRRTSILAASVIFIAGTFVVVLSPIFSIFIIGRILIGIAIGVASFVAPLYISEIAPESIRGALVSLNQLLITVGILIAYGVNYSFAAAGDWRAMFLAGVIPGTVLLVGMFLMPRSPRWLMFMNRPAEAATVLKKIRGTADVSDELGEIERSVRTEGAGTLSDLVAPAVRLPLLLGLGLAILQQATGINTVIYYAPTIFQFAGLAEATASIAATVGIGVVNVLVTLIAIRLVDRAGRRPLLLWSLAGMGIAMLLLGIGFALEKSGAGGAAVSLGQVTAVSLIIYVAAFALGLGPIFWLLIAEIYPLSVRGLAMSLATVTNWTANFLIAATFLSLVDLIGESGVFLLYAVVALLAWLFVFKLVPETKGLSLEQIEAYFRSRGRPGG
ncbi:Galactose transporter [Methanoculleus chikugoensis]|jgi:SP family galactose:H+ symporter-like MFS transporter|uniref:Galactose transporter n=1 Tax=Methanoculleus chikugoensis TaxID=118126 RepID=A0A1M4MNR8_9EURY|nr:sugar porter family MFS transporter [Methanoculleus chikugoensis]SCL76549.1 Galactose transporter [Methanoculleus chikugoensis]